MADVHFAPTANARDRCTIVTGNPVIDALVWASQQERVTAAAQEPQRPMILVTAHRRESFGKPLEDVCGAIRDIVRARDVEVLYLRFCTPSTRTPSVQETVRRELGDEKNVRLVQPLEYPEFVAAMNGSTLILTDSGGIQEEAPALGKPVLVLREVTERPEGVAAGTARVVGTSRRRIVDETLGLLDDPIAYAAMAQAVNPYGDGHASRRIVGAVRSFLKGEPLPVGAGGEFDPAQGRESRALIDQIGCGGSG